jgi:LPXTG-motif cell wall-anchored protein
VSERPGRQRPRALERNLLFVAATYALVALGCLGYLVIVHPPQTGGLLAYFLVFLAAAAAVFGGWWLWRRNRSAP